MTPKFRYEVLPGGSIRLYVEQLANIYLVKMHLLYRLIGINRVNIGLHIFPTAPGTHSCKLNKKWKEFKKLNNDDSTHYMY